MADYIYLLETRLSPAQQGALGILRSVAREFEATLFLTGGAVRDLTGGGSIRDLDLTLQGDPLKLRKALEKAGVTVFGENAPAHQLFLQFPGGVRVEFAAAMSVTFPKPGKPKYEFSNITEDLRRRDFTANGMAISLNEGSYGLLMDPLNGVADIENRELRLVSNYGFIEDPSRLMRAARLTSRLGWQMEEKTRSRYDTAKEEGYISALNPWNRGYEIEEIFHEDDSLRIMRALEAEGWMEHLFPSLNSSRANTAALADLADKQGLLQVQGILAQSAALAFPMITAKLAAPEAAQLKALFVRPGFTQEIDGIEAHVRDFAAKVGSKEYASPSAVWKLLNSSEPNLVLALFYSSKSTAVQSRLKTFLSESPQARQRIPYALMSEMRITSDLPAYAELVDKLFYELMDGKLSTPEEMKAYLEPYSPPAPPPPVNLRRARARKEARPSRAKAKKAAAGEAVSVTAEEEAVGIQEGLMEEGDLTGPGRGPEPTVSTPLSKVAPEKPAAGVKKSPAVAAKSIAVPEAETPAQAVLPRKSAVAVRSAAPAKTNAAKGSAAKEAPVTTAAPGKAMPAKTLPTAVKSAAPAKTAPAAPAKIAPTAAKKSAPVTAKKVVAPSKPASKSVPAAKGAVKAAPLKQAAGKAVPAKVAAKKAVPSKAVAKPAATKAAAKKRVPAKGAEKKTVHVKTPAKKQVATKKPARR